MAGNDSDDEFFQQFFEDSDTEEEFWGFLPGDVNDHRVTEAFFPIHGDLPMPDDTEIGWECGSYDEDGNLTFPEQPLISLPFTGK